MAHKLSSIDRSLLRSYPEIRSLLLEDSEKKDLQAIEFEQAEIKRQGKLTSMDDPPPRLLGRKG